MTAQPRAIPAPGMAVFSTRNGKYAQRQATPNMSVVIRSDPNEDRDAMTAKLQAEFPAICKSITTFVPKVGDYFDGYDQELQGYEFLRAVLLYIAAINAAESRKVHDFVGRWMASNREAFTLLTPEHGFEHLFTAADRNDHDEEFLKEATAQIQFQRDQATRNEAAQEVVRIQQERDRIAAEHRDLIHSQSRAYGPPSVSQNPQAVPDPEPNQNHHRRGPVRTSRPDKFPSQQGVFRQGDLRPQTRMQGHVNYGSSHRPSAHIEHPVLPIAAYPSLNMASNVPVPPTGYPSAQNYGFQPHAPVSYAHHDHKDFQPKGKRNPVKRSSDDARRSSSEAGGKPQSYGRRRSSQLDSSHFVQSPQPMFSSIQLPVDPSQPHFYPWDSMTGPAQGGQQQRKMIEPGPLDMQTAVSSGNYAQLPLMNSQINETASITNDASTSQSEQDVSQAGLPTTAASPPGSGNSGPQDDKLDQDLKIGKTMQSTVSQVVEQSGRSFDLHAFGHQLLNVQSSFPEVRSTASEIEKPAYLSRAGQDQFGARQTPRRSKKQRSPRKDDEHVKGLSIFIGGLPNEISKTTVRQMLEPCQGLADTTTPRFGARKDPNTPFSFYVFADFTSQDAAEEALERIPQTSFPTMPEGRFLSTGWPFKRDSTPNRHFSRDVESTERDLPQMSPTKAKKTDGRQSFSTHRIAREVALGGKMSEAIANKEPSSSTSRKSIDFGGVHATATGNSGSVNVRANLNPSEAGVHPDLAVKKDVVPAPGAVLDSIGHLIEDKNIRPVSAEPADEVVESEKQDHGQILESSNHPSAVDGPSDPAPISIATKLLEAEQIVRGGERDDHVAPVSHAKQVSKKKKGRNKNEISKSLDKIQYTERGQSSGGALNSENVKPPSTSQPQTAEKHFLGKAAFPEHKDDAAKNDEAGINASEPSNVSSLARALSDSEAHIVDTSTIAKSGIEISKKTPLTEQSPSPMVHAHSMADSLENPSKKDQSTNDGSASDNEPRPTTNAVASAKKSEAPVSAITMNEGESHGSQVMTQEGSSSAHGDEESTSFEHTSTMQTSSLQTERSNSIADASQPSTVHSSESSQNQQAQNTELDVEKLRTLLQADADSAIREDDGHAVDATTGRVFALGRRRSTVASDSLEFSEELMHKDSHVLPTTILAESVVNIDSAKRISHETSSAKPLDAVKKPDILKAATTTPPKDTSELSLDIPSDLSHPQSKLPENKNSPLIPPRSSSLQSVSAPIQTRQKKKPKQFPAVEESNESKSFSEEPLQADSQSLGQDAAPPSTDIIKSPPSTQSKGLKQKKGSKKKKKKTQSKTTSSLATESSVWMPSSNVSTSLPEPETPFRTEGGLDLRIPPLSSPMYQDRREVDISPMHKRRAGDDPAIIEREDLEVALEESGYGQSFNYFSSDHFPVNDPLLARLDIIAMDADGNEHDEWGQGSKAAKSDEGLVYQIQNMEKQHEIIQVILKQAADGRKGQDRTPPQTPSKNTKGKLDTVKDVPPTSSLEVEIEKIATRLISAKASRGEQDIGTSVEDRKIEKAKELLDLSPRRGLWKVEEKEWQKMATEYIEENRFTQVPAPSTSIRKMKLTNLNHLGSSPGTPLRGQGRTNRESPTYSNRPGSTIMTGPGSATAVITLKPGEDAATVTRECLADANTFFGYSEPSKSEQGADQGSANRASSESEEMLTAPTPPTLGRRTPSPELRKRALSLPSFSQCPETAKNLASTFDKMREMATSALTPGNDTGQLGLIGPQTNVPLLSNGNQQSPCEENVVGYWRQNSGAKNFEGFEEDQSDCDKDLTRKQDVEELGETIDPQKALSPWSQEGVSENEMTPDENQIRVVVTTKEEIEIIPSAGNPSASDGTFMIGSSANQITAEGNHIKTQTKDEPAVHGPEDALSVIESSEQTTQSADECSRTVESSPNSSASDSPHVKSFTPQTFDFIKGKDSATAKDHQNELEYPSLSRGRGSSRGGSSRSIKGGKSGSPTRGDYAAVAKKKVVKEEKQKGEKGAADNDGWAVAAEEAWGFKGGNGQKKPRRDT